MRTTSAQYQTQLVSGFQTAALVQLLFKGVVQASSDNLTAPNPFYVVDGSIQVDSTASFRRTLTGLKIVDPTGYWLPNDANDLLSVTSGAEIYVKTGMMVNGVPELFSQGYFGVQTSQVDDGPQGITITIGGSDRSRQISRNKTTAPYVILPNLNVVDQVKALWTAYAPIAGITFRSATTTHVTTYVSIDEQADPWQEGLNILQSIGFEGFFDSDGVCVIQPIPDINDSARSITYQYSEGMTGTIIDMSRKQDNEGIFNGQTVIGASTYGLTPARAVVWDTDFNSPTYYNGPYGRVMNFTQSDKVSYNAQALDMATGLLNKSKGLSEVVNLDIIPNHAHQEEDIITVTRTSSNLSNTPMFIDTMTVPIMAGSSTPNMPIQCRKRTV